MNEKKAKQLRRVIFGNKAYRGTKEYVALFFDKKSKNIDLKGGDIFVYTPFTIMIKPETPHADYRAAKRAFK